MQADKQTMVAYKGLFSYQGETSYFYYKDGVGLDCRVGNYQFKVKSDGIYVQDHNSGGYSGKLKKNTNLGTLFNELLGLMNISVDSGYSAKRANVVTALSKTLCLE